MEAADFTIRLGGLIGPKSLICFTLIACNIEICAAHRRSLLKPAAAQYATRTAVHESSDAVRSRKAQYQAPSENPQTGDTKYKTSSSRERSYAGGEIENRSPRKSIQAPQPPQPATRQQATQLLGGTGTSMSDSVCCGCRSVLILLSQREPAPAKRGTVYQKGGASRNFHPADRQGGTSMSVMYLLASGG